MTSPHAHIIDGKKLAQKILRGLARKKGVKSLSLAVVFVGKNTASASYIHKKQEMCAELGIQFQCIQLPSSVSQRRICEEITELAKDSSVSGIIVQLPLPSRLDTNDILHAIPVEKDVDCLSHRALVQSLMKGAHVYSPVAKAVHAVLHEHRISLKGKHVVVIGQGRLVGTPLALSLLSQGIAFTSLNRSTRNLASYTKNADVIISGTGKANILKGSMIRKGSVVIDAGTSGEKGMVQGDVHLSSVVKKASLVSTVPGGLGPVVVACLLENLVLLALPKRHAS